MSSLEKLFRLEVEFHRRVRALPPGVVDSPSLHTSYALQTGYERLIRETDRVTARDLESLRERFGRSGHAQDLLDACKSLSQLLGVGSS
jgi:hypothetical protein